MALTVGLAGPAFWRWSLVSSTGAAPNDKTSYSKACAYDTDNRRYGHAFHAGVVAWWRGGVHQLTLNRHPDLGWPKHASAGIDVLRGDRYE